MSTIDEILNELGEDFRQIAKGESIEEFVSNAEKWKYAVAFCDEFATYAPEAWESLLLLTDVSNAYFAAHMSKSPSLGQQAHSDLLLAVHLWALQHNLAATWVEPVAVFTLSEISLSSLIGSPAPKSLSMTRMTISGDDGVTVISSDYVPYSELIIPMELDPFIWSQTAETRSEFRRRARDTFMAELDRQIQIVEPADPAVTPDLLTVNQHWVQWSVVAFARNRAPGQIAKDLAANGQRVTGAGVDKGIAAVSHILGLNWTALKATRDVTRRYRS